MTSAFHRLGAMLAVAACFAATGAAFRADGATPASSRYTLTETRSHVASGPFTLFDGARIRLGGELYRVDVAKDRRVTFTSQGGAAFGPYQPVDGRIMQIGKAMYSFGWSDGRAVRQQAPAAAPESNRATARREAPIAEFAPLPPKPELIEIPPEVEHRTVPALDLPALPDASSPFAWNFWLAPIDRTPLKWKVESVSGKEVDFERRSVGAGLSCNSWSADAAYSMSGKSGAIVPGGMGFSGASIDDASGFAISAGYKRPFLSEGGWIASAGIQGRIRREKGDISSTALVSTGVEDTNDVGNVVSEYKSRTSSVTITEKSLRLDFELGYRYESFYGFAGLAVQPLSSVSVSGGLPYGDDTLKVSAKHDDAIGAIVGGSYEFPNGIRAFADLMILAETRFRIGVARDF